MGILPKKPYLKQRGAAGLTLVEVLIALAIVGIAMTAIIKSSTENIRGTSHLQNKMIATWVGMEVMSEVRAGLLTLTLGENKKEKMPMLGQDWYWQARLDETGNSHINKITVKVRARAEEEDPLVNLESYRYGPEKE